LACRDAPRQRAAGRLAAISANESMPLVFGHMRLDRRQFPHLMPQRLRIAAGKLCSATAARGRLERLDLVALVRRHERPLVLLVPRLAAPFLLRRGRPCRRLGVRMLRAGRKRRILRRLV
jgi:hypothetical protein